VLISGTPTQGQTLTASDNITDSDGLGAITYRWLRNGVDTGVTGASYALTEADVGQSLLVQATYTDAHGSTEQVDSASTAGIAAPPSTPTPEQPRATPVDTPVLVPQPDATLPPPASGGGAAPSTTPDTPPTRPPSATPKAATIEPTTALTAVAAADSPSLTLPDRPHSKLLMALLPHAGQTSLSRAGLAQDWAWQMKLDLPATANATDNFLRQLLIQRTDHSAPLEIFSLDGRTHGDGHDPRARATMNFAEAPEEGRVKLHKLSLQASGTILSIGTVWWAARISGLLTSLAVSAPAWRGIDPLPVLAGPESDGTAGDDDSVIPDNTPDNTPDKALEGQAARLFDQQAGADHSMEVIG